RDEVLNRRMPPWDAVKGVGEFRDDPSLSVPEIDLVVAWVEGGAPEGNPIYAPSAPIVDSAPASPAPRRLALKSGMTLGQPLIRSGIGQHGAADIVALVPDQSVRRLLWVRDFRQSSNRTYTLLRPMSLPKGTKVIVYGAGAILTTAPEP